MRRILTEAAILVVALASAFPAIGSSYSLVRGFNVADSGGTQPFAIHGGVLADSGGTQPFATTSLGG